MTREDNTVARNTSSGAAEPPMSARELALRSLKIVLELFAVYCMAEQVSPFFYQQF